jgi:cyclohexadieny/prephenate dehydrogenase
MWRDVFLNNREAVLEMMGRLYEDIALLQKAIRAGDGKTLHRVFTRSRRIRRSIVQAKQD